MPPRQVGERSLLRGRGYISTCQSGDPAGGGVQDRMREGPTLLPGPAQNLQACGRTSCESDPWGLTPWPRHGRPAGSRPRVWGSGQRHCPSVPVAAPLFSLLESQAEICRVTSGRPPLIGPGAVGRVEGGGQCPAQHTPTHPGGRCPPAPTFPGLRARTSPAPCWRPVVSLVLELGVGPGRCLRWGCRTLPLGVPASSSQEQDSEKGRRWLELYRPVALSPAAGMPRRSGRVGWLGRQAPCHSSVLSTRGHGEGRAQCEWGSRVTASCWPPPGAGAAGCRPPPSCRLPA